MLYECLSRCCCLSRSRGASERTVIRYVCLGTAFRTVSATAVRRFFPAGARGYNARGVVCRAVCRASGDFSRCPVFAGTCCRTRVCVLPAVGCCDHCFLGSLCPTVVYRFFTACRCLPLCPDDLARCWGFGNRNPDRHAGCKGQAGHARLSGRLCLQLVQPVVIIQGIDLVDKAGEILRSPDAKQ